MVVAHVQGCDAKLREEDGKPYVTDNDNYIVDLYFTEPIKDANQAGKEVSSDPHVIKAGQARGVGRGEGGGGACLCYIA